MSGKRIWDEEQQRRNRRRIIYQREHHRQRAIDEQNRNLILRGGIKEISHLYLTREGTVAWSGRAEDDVPERLGHRDRQDADRYTIFVHYREASTERRTVHRQHDPDWKAKDYRRFRAILERSTERYRDPARGIDIPRSSFLNHHQYALYLQDQQNAGDVGPSDRRDRVREEGEEELEERFRIQEEGRGGVGTRPSDIEKEREWK
jgi:hypothetical protein